MVPATMIVRLQPLVSLQPLRDLRLRAHVVLILFQSSEVDLL